MTGKRGDGESEQWGRSAGWRVLLEGAAIELSSREFAVLEILITRSGRVVSKETLSQDVLSRPLGPFDRSIDVHISKLRRKLGLARDGESLIGTVHRGGYIFRIVEE